MSRPISIQISPGGTYNQMTEVDRRVLPSTWANEPWTFYHYPMAWQWSAKYGYYPDLSVATHKAGCNGVDQVRDGQGRIIKGRVNTNGLLTGCRAKGGIEVDPSDPRLGPWKGFIKHFPCENGGKRYVFGLGSGASYRGENFRRLANGQIKATEAGEVFLEFCAYLRDNDLVHPVDAAAVEQLIDGKVKTRDLFIRHSEKSAYAAAHVDRLTAEVDAMRADWDKLAAKYAEAIAAEEGEQMPILEDDAPASVRVSL